MSTLSELNGHAQNGMSTNGMSTNGAASDVDADLALLVQYQQLQSDLAAAQQRVEAARRRIAERDAEIQAALRTELRLAQDELAALAEQHDARLAALRAETDATVARILAEHPEPTEVAHDE